MHEECTLNNVGVLIYLQRLFIWRSLISTQRYTNYGRPARRLASIMISIMLIICYSYTFRLQNKPSFHFLPDPASTLHCCMSTRTGNWFNMARCRKPARTCWRSSEASILSSFWLCSQDGTGLRSVETAGWRKGFHLLNSGKTHTKGCRMSPKWRVMCFPILNPNEAITPWKWRKFKWGCLGPYISLWFCREVI